MYRKFSLQDVETIQNNFFENLNYILRKEKCENIKQFIKNICQEGEHMIYFNRNQPIFRCEKSSQLVSFIDEQQSIQIDIPYEELSKLDGLYKRLFLTAKSKKQSNASIQDILKQACIEGKFNTIHDKPFIVYDIETIGEVFNITQQEFAIAYAATINNGKITYEYIDKDNVEAFVDKMLHFNGYIIGYNNIFFDNPVIIHNTTKKQEDIEILNKKSIDLFTFINHLTGKKIGLNKVASSLIGIEKTLESGLEGANIYKKYLKTGDKKLLDTFKKYCKNDVKMTLYLLFYLVHFQKLYIEGEEKTYSIQDFIHFSGSNHSKPQTNNVITNQRIL